MLNWRELPFLRLLLPFMAGIVLAFYVETLATPASITMAITLVGAFLTNKIRGWYRFRWLFGVFLAIFLFAFGYRLTWLHNELHRSSHFSHGYLPSESIFYGEITDAPTKKENWVKLVLSANAAGPNSDSLRPSTGNILLYLERDSTAESLAFGDKLVFRGKASPVPPAMNPDAFDYGRYLHFQNIHYQSFVKKAQWAVVERANGFSVMGEAIAWRNRFTEILRKHLPTANEFSVGAALILGYRDEVPEDILTAYSETGAMHILAVSGMHVGVLYVILHFFLGRITSRHWAWRFGKAAAVILAIWAFAFVTGASPSVLRAAAMFTIVTVGEAANRNKNFYNTLAASAFCLLWVNPFWLASVSFQLSYLAVWGIVYFEPKIRSLWPIANKIGHYLWQLTCVSLGAQLATLPLTLYYFHQFPTYFWLSSLILVPLSGLELGTGLLLLALDGLWEGGAFWVGRAYWWMVKLGNESILLIQRLPAALFDGIWIGAPTTVLLYLALLSLMVALAARRLRPGLAGLALLLAVGIGYSFSELKERQHRQIAIYHVYKHTAIDFFDGKQAVSITDPLLEEKPLRFAAEGHRFAMGGTITTSLTTADTVATALPHLFSQNGFVQFFDKKLYLVSGPVAQEEAGHPKMAVDYLLFHGSPAVTVAEMLAIFEVELVIFDASNKRWRLEQWKAECADLGVAFYDINEKGAFLLDF